MSHPVSPGLARHGTSLQRNYAFWTFALSLFAVIATFMLSVYVTDLGSKEYGFLAIVILFLLGCAGLYLWHARFAPHDVINTANATADMDHRLRVLDEAREFFAGSLTVADAFRLVVSRITGLIAAKSVTLLLLDPERDAFVVTESDDGAATKGIKFSKVEGIIGRCFEERDVAVDELMASAAVPLKNKAEIFGILLFTLETTTHSPTNDLASLLDAIGERVAPLVLGSIAYERSQRNALTDATTELPNERAFHLVLENQVAEALRRGRSRPLTILSFDIKGFDELNSNLGFGAGDRLLNFVAQSAKDSLRQMDFLARGLDDEFLAILPTASREIAHEIIARLQASVVHRTIKVTDMETTEVDLTFGYASIGSDGETPNDLLAVARERRQQSKSSVPGSVVWFPQEITH